MASCTRLVTAFGVGCALSLCVTSAAAHILISSPTPRVPGNANLKATPCGPNATWGQGEVHTVTPGEQVTLVWEETVPHAGYMRVVLGTAGDDSLAMPSEADYQAFTQYYQNGGMGDVPAPIENPSGELVGDMLVYYDYYGQHPGMTCGADEAGGCTYEVIVTMPDECEQCTLQVVQTMAEAFRTYGNDAHYYQCVDIVVEGEAATPGEEMNGAGAMPGVGMEPEGAGGQLDQQEPGMPESDPPPPGMPEPMEMMGMEAAEPPPGMEDTPPPLMMPVAPLPEPEPGPGAATPPGAMPEPVAPDPGDPAPTPQPGAVASQPAAMPAPTASAPMNGVMSGAGGGGDDGGCSVAVRPTPLKQTWLAGLVLGLGIALSRRRRG